MIITAWPPYHKDVFGALKKDLDARNAKGWKSYGKPMMTNDGRDTLMDAFEEALDLVVYLKKALLEREISVRPHGVTATEHPKNNDNG